MSSRRRSRDVAGIAVGGWCLHLGVDRDRARGLRRATGAVVVVLTLLAVGAGSAAADPTPTDPSAQVSPYVVVAQPGIRFVLVSVVGESGNRLDFGDFNGCDRDAGLTISLPNGVCSLDSVEVTNGDAASEIDVSALDFSPDPLQAESAATDQLAASLQVHAPAGGGDSAGWRLCSVAADDAGYAAPGAPQCDGALGAPYSGQFPGPDQVWLQTVGAGDNADRASVGPDLGCDQAFSGPVGEGSCVAAPDTSAIEDLDLTAPQSSSDGAGSFYSTITWTALP